MLIYLSIIILSVLLCVGMKPGNGLAGRRSASWDIRWVFLLVILGGIAGWRDHVGTDYGTYTDIFSLMKDIPYNQLIREDEPLFSILNRACADLFGDYVPMFVLVAMLTVALLLYGVYRESSQYWLSMFLLITGMYYFDLFNGSRQMVATAIMFAAYPLLKRKKWIPLILLTLVATGFHASAPIILAAFFFAAYVRPGSFLMWFVAAVFIISFLSYQGFVDFLTNIMNSMENRYAHYDEMLAQSGQGANVLRFALTLMPVLFGAFSWRLIKRQRKDVGILLNLSLVNALFMLLATRHWIFARYCMYFGVYNILLWPEIINAFEPRSKRLMTIGVVFIYFVYFVLIVHTDSNLLPYRSVLFGGVYH